jgi:hypothetical protein
VLGLGIFLGLGSSAEQAVLGGDMFKSAIKANDQSVTNSTTYVSDADLQFPIGANETWLVEWDIRITSTSAGGHKTRVDTPSGCSGDLTFEIYQDTGGPILANAGLGLGTTLGTSGATTYVYHLRATIVNGATPGTVALQFAQGVANGTPTIQKANSSMFAAKVG